MHTNQARDAMVSVCYCALIKYALTTTVVVLLTKDGCTAFFRLVRTSVSALLIIAHQQMLTIPRFVRINNSYSVHVLGAQKIAGKCTLQKWAISIIESAYLPLAIGSMTQ